MYGENLEYKVFGSNGPTILIENGIGCSFYDWHFVVDGMKEFAKVIVYHRAGYGRSSKSTKDRTTRQIAKDVKGLLSSIGVKNEIILVGHSFGGLCVQQFARMYPHLIKGVVLVDSTSVNFSQLYTDETPTMCELASSEKTMERWQNMAEMNRNELREALDPIILSEEENLPLELKEELIHFSLSTGLYDTMISEMKYWKEDCLDINTLPNFPNVPTSIIARDSNVAIEFYINHGLTKKEATIYEGIWRRLQLENMSLSNQSKFYIAEGSDHHIHLEKPQMIINCIKSMIDKCQLGGDYIK